MKLLRITGIACRKRHHDGHWCRILRAAGHVCDAELPRDVRGVCPVVLNHISLHLGCAWYSSTRCRRLNLVRRDNAATERWRGGGSFRNRCLGRLELFLHASRSVSGFEVAQPIDYRVFGAGDCRRANGRGGRCLRRRINSYRTVGPLAPRSLVRAHAAVNDVGQATNQNRKAGGHGDLRPPAAAFRGLDVALEPG